VNFRPYKYGRKCLTQYIIAKPSFSYVSYFILLSVKVREVYAIARSLFTSLCENTAISEASVVKINGFEKSGYCKTGSSHNFCFNVSNNCS